VRVFTRTLNDVTAAVPEIVAAAREAASTALILDGEAIALRADGRPHPFQTTMRRPGRKADHSALRDSHATLRETAEDLARFNRAAVGRELRMIDLKKEINDLCATAGQPPRYDLGFERGKAKDD